jgi:hypothetical protein
LKKIQSTYQVDKVGSARILDCCPPNKNSSNCSIGHETIDEDVIVDVSYVEKFLKISERAREELEKVSKIEFNIFNLQKETN